MIMTEQAKEQFDKIIDALHLEQATGLTREQLHKEIGRVSVLLDLAYVLADVCDSLMFDVTDILAKVKTPLDDRDRSFFKEMKKLANATRKWAQRATRDTRYSERDIDFANESDWWKNLILMVEDRTGTDELKTRQLIRWISTMPSQMHLFDSIHTKDFLRLTDEYDTIPRTD